jgi:polyhydroxybutyrate depolymerase
MRAVAGMAVGLALVLGPASAGAVDAGCGGDVPCRVEGGDYRVSVPPGARGAVLFFHGYRGSAEAQMGARGLIEAAARHGLAFAAPDGMDGSWSHPGSPSGERDERAFVAAVLDDIEARFGFKRDAVVLSGFSQGASMAWYAGCDLGRSVAGAVTFAGVFWSPPPTPADCRPPPPWVHVHGTNDRIFPLAGRAIGERWRQGDTRAAVATVDAAAGCAAAEEPVVPLAEGFSCTARPACAGGPVTLCLHGGGHEIRAEWLDAGLARLGF